MLLEESPSHVNHEEMNYFDDITVTDESCKLLEQGHC